MLRQHPRMLARTAEAFRRGLSGSRARLRSSTVAAKTAATSFHGDSVTSDTPSDHRVAPGRLAEPLRAELRRALLRLEVHVDQPEAVAVAISPLEVVLC